MAAWLFSAICVLIVDWGLCASKFYDYDYLVFENHEATREIFVKELESLSLLRSLKSRLETRRDEIREFLATHEHLDEINPPEFAANPVNVFTELKWLLRQKDLVAGGKRVNEDIQSYSQRIQNLTSDFPSRTELQAATRGLSFLFQTYNLDYVDATQGKLTGAKLPFEPISFQCAENITSSDLVRFLSVAYEDRNYDTCIDILRILQQPNRAKLMGSLTSEFEGFVARKKKECVQYNNQYLMKREVLAGSGFRTKQYLVSEKSLKRLKNQSKVIPKAAIADGNSKEGQNLVLQSYCRNEGFITPPVHGRPNRPKCRLLHHDDPYLRLGPIKLEILKRNPILVVFHDILTDTEIDRLIQETKPNLSRTRRVDAAQEGNQFHEYRSGAKRRIVAKTVQAWFKELEHERGPDEILGQNNVTGMNPVLKYIADEYDTNFNFTVLDPVTNYGLGGLCEAHIDPHGFLEGAELPYNRENLRLSGDMLGTFMAWLSHCDAGGATAFMDYNEEVTVWPTRGSAAFWLSLDRKGFRDLRTNHVGCPVLKGQKWILNKWIYLFDQFRHYPCSTSPFEMFQSFWSTY